MVLDNSVLLDSGSSAFDIGDFNRDGLTDMAVANLGIQKIDLLVGDGTGQFMLLTTIDNVAAPSDVVVDDLDGDGQRDDLAVTKFSQDVNIGQQGSSDFFLPSTVTVLRLEVAEESLILTPSGAQVDFAFQSADPMLGMDVNRDGRVTALDALTVINALDHGLAESEPLSGFVPAMTYVNDDDRTTAFDALVIINHLMDAEEIGNSELSDGLRSLSDEPDGADRDEDDRVAAVDLILPRLLFSDSKRVDRQYGWINLLRASSCRSTDSPARFLVGDKRFVSIFLNRLSGASHHSLIVVQVVNRKQNRP